MPEHSSARSKALFSGVLALYVGTTAALYLVAFLPAGHRGFGYLAIHAGMTALCLAAWKLTGKERGFTVAILVAGVAVRLLLLRVPAFSSNDVFRYLWDGWIAAQGRDPYSVSPEQFLTLQPAGDFRSIWPDNAAYPAIYPPLAMAIFSWCARWGPEEGVGAWKLITTVASLGTLFLSWLWLKRRGALGFLALPALFPLLVLEAGVGAHLDALLAPLLLLALMAAHAKRDVWAGTLLGVATLLKIYPLCLFPLFIVDKDKRRAAWLLGSGLCVIAGGYGLARAYGWSGAGSLGVYLRGWSFGSPVGRVFEWLLPRDLARLSLLVGFLGAYGLFVFRRGRAGEREWDVVKGLCLLWAYSPVVFPWYLVPLAAVGALLPSAFVLTWASLLPLTYEVLDSFDRGWGWTPAVWPLVVIAAGWIAINAKGRPRARRSNRAGAAP